MQAEARSRHGKWHLDVHNHDTHPPQSLLDVLSQQSKCEDALLRYQAPPCRGKFHFRKNNAILAGPISQRLTKAMNSPAVLGLMRWLAESSVDAFRDVRFTRYMAGDYILLHTDHEASRMLTFTLYLTKDWSAGFGGGFLWCGGRGANATIHTIQPAFNSLVLFRTSLDSLHMVSVVKETAPWPRYALQGWFTSSDEAHTRHSHGTRQTAAGPPIEINNR